MSVIHPFHRLLPEQAVFLRHRALRLTGNAHGADDLVQATLLKAWTSRDSFQQDTNLRAWLFTILRNTFLSQLRKYRLEVQDIDGERAESLVVEASQEHAVSLKELMTAITQLPATQRHSLVLMGVYGYSQLEVADVSGCTVGTVKSRVSRGRAALSRLLDDEVLQPVARRDYRPGIGAMVGAQSGRAAERAQLRDLSA